MKPAAADWASRKSQSAATSPMGALARSVKRACRAGIRHLERVCQRSRSPARQRVWASLFRRGRRARSSSCIVLSTCLSKNLRHRHRSFFAFTFPGFRLARLIVAAKVPLAAGCASNAAAAARSGRVDGHRWGTVERDHRCEGAVRTRSAGCV